MQMRCPICLENLTNAVMASCCHVYCRPCIETMASCQSSCQSSSSSTSSTSTLTPSSSNINTVELQTKCPICRNDVKTLTEVPWLNDTSVDTDMEDDRESNDQKPNNQEFNLQEFEYGACIASLVEELKLRIPSILHEEAEDRHVARVCEITKDKEQKEQKLRDELAKLEADYHKRLTLEYQKYQEELTNEAIKTKQIESENEYVEFLIDIGTSLSKQSPQVLDQHFLSYTKKLQKYIPTVMGMRKDQSLTYPMPETPMAYIVNVENVGKLLVGDGKRLWYYQEPQVSIAHSGLFVQGTSKLYVVEPGKIYVYNLDLSLSDTLTPPDKEYFLTVSISGQPLTAETNSSTFQWGRFEIDKNYDKIWLFQETLVILRGKTIYHYRWGTISIFRPNGVNELYDNHGWVRVFPRRTRDPTQSMFIQIPRCR